MKLLEQLQWRYATKRMNGKKIEADKLEVILEAIRLAPTSYGLQPFKVVVIENPELLKKIHAEACQQPQVLECSQLLVFAVKKMTPQLVDEYLDNTAKTRGIEVESLGQYRTMMLDTIASRDEATLDNWASRQAYIGLGVGLVAAANQQVDATPIEGFLPAAMDKLLDLPALGLHSVVVMALGYRNAELDYLSKAAKVRVSADAFFVKK